MGSLQAWVRLNRSAVRPHPHHRRAASTPAHETRQCVPAVPQGAKRGRRTASRRNGIDSRRTALTLPGGCKWSAAVRLMHSGRALSIEGD
jgi:redox-sensitive bicupin YhaK (pirin superfamily)